MIQCPTCKQMLDAGVRFCPHDGTPLTETSAQATVPTPSGARPRSAELALPIVVGGRYRLEEKRGGGGMAKVYRAVDITLERDVAVKLINQELRQEEEFDARFQREARIASQLADPHIVVVHDYGIDPQYGPYLVMEYLKGESLRERLHSKGPLPYKAGLQLGAQLLLALIHAHDKNIVHRDIKPDNIFLLNQSGVRLHLRVLDFGIARIFRRDDPGRGETLTSPGAVLGTPRYMSPEQLAGQPVDGRTDLYSAAVVIHEAITGQLPYISGKKLCELCPEATREMQELLDQCLKPNPAERPEGPLEVYLRLQELGKASGVLLLPPGALEKLAKSRHSGGQSTITPELATTKTLPPSGAKKAKRTRLLLTLGIVILLVLAGAAVVAARLLWPQPAPSPNSGPESLMGLKIGDSRQKVQAAPDVVDTGPVRNPWETATAPEYLGHVLSSKLLGIGGDDLQRLDIWRAKDLCVVMLDDKVIAVVVQTDKTGKTGRDVGVSTPESVVTARYGDDYEPLTVASSQAGKTKHIQVRIYHALGVAFEIQDGAVVAITLFPAAPP
ncbi:MAG TPA: protein kinase, partial [Gemmataceae bacterium]|nr:protein kinase [Gemmataceae bacterium]